MPQHRLIAPSKKPSRLALILAALALCIPVGAVIGDSVASAAQVTRTQIATDSYARTVASGFGSAASGGQYTVAGPATFSVAPGAGTIGKARAGSTSRATLASVSATDTEAQSTISLPSLAGIGRGVYNGVAVRAQSDGSAYIGRVTIDDKGKMDLSVARSSTILKAAAIPGTYAAGQKLDLDVMVTGSNPVQVSVRAWIDGQSQPAWQLVVSDSSSQRITRAGAVGLWEYVSSSATAPTTVQVRQFTAWSLTTTTAATTTPTPTPTPTPAPNPPANQTTTPPTSGSAGSALPGSTAYAVPANAIFVAPGGSDSGAGTLAAPLKTVATAIAKASSGATIVLRAGTYHEAVTIPGNKTLTIQSYPKEAVWFDASVPVTGFVKSGSVWKVSGWTTKFDSSPTFTQGAADNTAAGWSFVNPSYPMAAHPDQVWLNDVAQRQVASLSQVTAGAFYVDYSSSTLYVGSDPTGKSVAASTLQQALRVQSNGSVLRGLGVRRYAASVPQFGSVLVQASNVLVENLYITDSSVNAISVIKPNVTLRYVTAIRSGMLGVLANQADGLVADHLLVQNNNVEHFNQGPTAGGMKVTSTRGVSISNSDFDSNDGTGLWFDVSCYDITLVGNKFSNNGRHGVFLEISAVATVVGNIMSGNAGNGLEINNTSSVQAWNNTLVDNAGSDLYIAQDTRSGSNPNDYGHDSRRPFPDPTMTWLVGPVQFSNNVVSSSGSTSVGSLAFVRDFTGKRTPAQMGVTMNGNVWARGKASVPSSLITWSTANYSSLSAFTQATGQDASSVASDGKVVLSGSFALASDIAALATTKAQPLPAALATLAGQSAGTRHFGAWRS